MKAITVRQPWAECIARGAKLVENRSAITYYRGPLAIHAGQGWSGRGATDPRVRGTVPVEKLSSSAPLPDRLPFGLIVAVGEVVDAHPAAGCCRPWGDEIYEGRRVHHWVLENVRRVHGSPVMKGRLGLWTLDLDAPELSDLAGNL